VTADSSAPGAVVEAPSSYNVPEWPGYTCTTLFEPGFLAIAALQAEVPRSITEFQSCAVTTKFVMRMRAGPSLESETLAYIPFLTEVQTRGHVPQWFLVDYDGWTGWLSSLPQYVYFEGDCAEVLCSQNEEGTFIRCRP